MDEVRAVNDWILRPRRDRSMDLLDGQLRLQRGQGVLGALHQILRVVGCLLLLLLLGVGHGCALLVGGVEWNGMGWMGGSMWIRG